MNDTGNKAERCVLVAVHVSSHDAPIFEFAGCLAAELRAELRGLFIEDSNLLRVAGLPFSREIDRLSGELRPLDTAEVELALRNRAEGARLAIAETAQRQSLRWSFRVSRGKLAQTMLSESLSVDLLLFGNDRSPSTVAGGVSRGPIIIADDGRLNAGLFEMGRRLARVHDDAIVRLAVRETLAVAEGPEPEWHASCVQRCSPHPESLLRALQQWQPELLLIDRASDFASSSSISLLLDRLPCPLAIVPSPQH